MTRQTPTALNSELLTDAPAGQVRVDIEALIEQLWSREADDFRCDPQPDHPLLAMVRLLLWMNHNDQQRLPPSDAPRISADIAAIASIAAGAGIEVPEEPRSPAALLDVVARLIDAVSAAETRKPWAHLFWFVAPDMPTLSPARIRHEFTMQTDSPDSRLLSVHLVSASGLVLATVAYRSGSDLLLRASSGAADRHIATVEDVTTVLISDTNEALAAVWANLHELRR